MHVLLELGLLPGISLDAWVGVGGKIIRRILGVIELVRAQGQGLIVWISAFLHACQVFPLELLISVKDLLLQILGNDALFIVVLEFNESSHWTHDMALAGSSS